MMPLWIPLLTIAIALVVAVVVSSRDMFDEVTSAAILLAMSGAAMVLVMRLLPASLLGPHLIRDWITLLAPLIMILVAVVVGSVRGRRQPDLRPQPQTTCSRCDAGL